MSQPPDLEGLRTNLRDALEAPESVTGLSLDSDATLDASDAIRACPNLATLTLISPHVRLETLEHPRLRQISITGAQRLELPATPPEDLRRFRLGSCAVERLPAMLAAARSLKELEVERTPLATLEGLPLGGRLRVLTVRDGALREVPPAVLALPHLEQLDLEGNRIAELPTEVGLAGRLQKLVLRRNALTALPDALGTLSGLRTLDLGENQIAALPESMTGLSKLQTLSVERNPSIANVLTVAQALGRGSLRALYIKGARLPRADVKALMAMKRPAVYR